jgi:putative tributyrin esterase
MFINQNFFSTSIGMAVAVNIILPEGYKAGDGTKTLYLLHGHSDDYTAWSRYTSIERYAREAGIAVVMPAADKSFYLNIIEGWPYWTYISDELPKVIRNVYGLSDKKEDNFVAGLSMGGYGAMRHALVYPDRYFAVGSFSGALDILRHDRFADVKNTDGDLFWLLKKHFAEKTELPRIYQYIGRQDFLYDSNTRFQDLLRDLSIPSEYVEEDGDHAWRYWDEQVKKFIPWALEK